MNFLSPEQLAATQREYDNRVDSYKRHNEEPNTDTGIIGGLLDHIEAREQQVKAELQGLLREVKPTPNQLVAMALEAGVLLSPSKEHNGPIYAAAARLGIALD